MKSLFGLLFLFASSQIFPQDLCLNLAKKFTSNSSYIFYSETLNAKQKDEMVQILENIDQLFAENFQPPNQVQVHGYQMATAASYSASENKINVPYQLNYGGYTKHPKFSLPIIAHEYGHAYFATNLRLADGMTWQRKLQSLTNDIALYSEKISSIMDDMSQFPAFDPSREQLADEWRKLLTQQTELHNQLNRYIYSMVHEFNELFADLVALVLFQDPKTIYHSTYYVGMGETYAPAVLRDFSHIPSRAIENNLVKNHNPYDRLVFLRYHLWKNYFSRPGINQKAQAKILRETLQVFEQYIQDNIQNPNYQNMTIQKLNDDLITLIDQKIQL